MPNRVIKESVTTSATLAQLSDAAERHFWRLIVQADDFGYLDARPEVLRAHGYSMMLDAVSLQESEARTQALVVAGLLHLFQQDGKRYGHFPTWDKHQQKRAKYSKYPQVQSCDITCQQMLASAPENRESRIETLESRIENREGRKPKKTTAAAKDLLALYSEEEMIEITKLFPGINLEWEAGKCTDWHNAKGGSGNWKLAFKNWLANAKPLNGGGNGRFRNDSTEDKDEPEIIYRLPKGQPILGSKPKTML